MDGSAHVKLASTVSADDGQKSAKNAGIFNLPETLFVQIVF
jgi:hypothetical protein